MSVNGIETIPVVLDNIEGVPTYSVIEFKDRQTNYCLLIPILNEEANISKELLRAKEHGIPDECDIIICDGGSSDNGANPDLLASYGVNALLVKLGPGKQGAQLRMGFWWALQRGYEGFISIDGNNKDSIEDVPCFIEKLDEGYDFIQGSRYLPGGHAINTPMFRHLSVKLLHAPIISLTARHRFTDTTNAFRAYSRRYITHPGVKPFRGIFIGYELLAYLSVRASQLHLRVCEIPVTRAYPKTGKIPTKISPIRGSFRIFIILIKNFLGRYKAEEQQSCSE